MSRKQKRPINICHRQEKTTRKRGLPRKQKRTIS